MRTILILFGNELHRFLRDKTALSLTFLVPTVLIYIFGHVFGVNDGGAGPKGIPIAIVSATDAPVVGAITAALQKEKAFKVLTTEKQDDKEVPLTEQNHNGAHLFPPFKKSGISQSLAGEMEKNVFQRRPRDCEMAIRQAELFDRRKKIRQKQPGARRQNESFFRLHDPPNSRNASNCAVTAS